MNGAAARLLAILPPMLFDEMVEEALAEERFACVERISAALRDHFGESATGDEAIAILAAEAAAL
jgi:hypothetical protein